MQTILAVDDSITMRQLLAQTLERAGYRVLAAADGLEALEEAKRHAVDLVITDQTMPRMNGLALTAALRAQPAYRSVPVLMLTTESGDGIKAAARAAGATGWLLKPFDPDRLLQVLARLLPAQGGTA